MIVADTAEDSTVGKCSEIAGLNDEVVLSGLHTIPYRPIEKFASGYLGYYLNSSAYHKQLIPLMQGIKVTSISKSAMQNSEIVYPKSVEEQGKIGNYFQSLDHLITLHHRKRVILKKMKVSDWEQRKFSELYKKVNEKNIFRFGVDKIISVANMYFKEDVKKPNDEYMRTYNIMRLGDIAFEGNKSKNFSHGRFVENTIGDGIVSHVFDVFRPVMDYDLLFWKYLINNENVMGRIMTRCTKASTMMTNLVAKDFLNENILVPTIEEQHKIGTYIDKLDHLITLHHRKCIILRKMKVNDWEQRKLGEVFEQTTNFVNLSKDDIELWSLTVEDGLTPKSERYNREFLVKKDTNFKEVRPGDIVYNPMNMTLGAVGYNGMSKSVAISGYYTTMITKDGNDSYYINTWLKSPQAISLYKIYATGSLIEKQRVQFPTLSTIPAVFPKYEEQHKIGCYFEAIDHLITLHHHEEFCTENVLIYIEINITIQIKEDIMAELESVIEQKLIDQLVYGDSQWTYRADLKTEEDL